MKRWVMLEYGKMELDTVKDPVPRDDEVIVKVEVAQPSVTDVLMFKGVDTGSPGVKKLGEKMKKGPVPIPGHEFSGTVVEKGKRAKLVEIGDRVSANIAVPCGKCIRCKEYLYDYCINPQHIGTALPGCFAEYIAVPEFVIVRLPKNTTFSEGACIQPLATAVSVGEEISFGDTVAILGQGIMGNYCMQIAKIAGARKVICTDVKQENLDLSMNLGADLVINGSIDDPVQIVLENTNNMGVDVVLECAGGRGGEGLAGFKTVNEAFKMIRVEGKIVQVAYPVFGETYPLDFKVFKSRRARFINNQKQTRRHLVLGADLVASKRVNLKPLITHVLNGIDKVPEAFEITGNKSKYGALNPAQVKIAM